MRSNQQYELKKGKKTPQKEKKESLLGLRMTSEKNMSQNENKGQKNYPKTPKHFERKNSVYLTSKQIRSSQKEEEKGGSVHHPSEKHQSQRSQPPLKNFHYVRSALSLNNNQPVHQKISESTAKQEYQIKQKQFKQYSKIQKQLKIQLSNQKKLNYILQNQNQALKKKNQCLQKENKGFKDLLKNVSQEIERKNKELQELKKKIKKNPQEEKKKSNYNSYDCQKYDLESKLTEAQSHQDEFQHIHLQNDELKLTNLRLKEKVKSVDIENEMMKKTLYHIQKEQTHLVNKNKKLMARLTEITEDQKIKAAAFNKKFIKKELENSLEFSLQI